MTPEMIADYLCETGEGPLWHPMERRLYWVDIPEGRMFRYDPATGQHQEHYNGGVIGGYTVQADGALLLFMAGGAVGILRDGVVRPLIEGLPGEEESRFNDVIADPEGRVFCGTMSGPRCPGRLYRLDIDGSIEVVLEGVGTSNGLGFTPDLTGLYHTDTRARTITLYDYDRASGAISGPRVFVRTPENDGEGRPDGMTVDAEGHVWSARWDGSCIVRHGPDGSEERRVTFPARKVSSLTFGGPDLDMAYVTTAGGGDKEREGRGAGALFRVDLGVHGRPEFLSRVGLA
jgi:D-xylonolactonase